MKRFAKVIAVVASTVLACLVVVGCGNKEAYKADFVGTWEIVETQKDGEAVSEEDINLLKSLGMNVYAEIAEDGTCTLEPFGSTMSGTWDVTAKGKGTMTIGEVKSDDAKSDDVKDDQAASTQTVTMTIEEDGRLFLENADSQGMRFKKIDPSEKKESVAPSATGESAGEAIEEVVDGAEGAEAGETGEAETEAGAEAEAKTEAETAEAAESE